MVAFKLEMCIFQLYRPDSNASKSNAHIFDYDGLNDVKMNIAWCNRKSYIQYGVR